jgi:hypothetical protein
VIGIDRFRARQNGLVAIDRPSEQLDTARRLQSTRSGHCFSAAKQKKQVHLMLVFSLDELEGGAHSHYDKPSASEG